MSRAIRPSRVKQPARRRHQAGFGIVELMVGMLLGLMIIGGAIAMYVRSQESYRTNEALSRVQENMRVSFEIMAKELRQADGTICGTRQMANVLNNATAWSSNWAAGALIGYDENTDAPGVTTGTTAGQRLAATDAIQVLSGSLGASTAITGQDNSAATMTLQDATGFAANDLVVACDGATAAIFQITSVSANTIGFASGAGTPGNCSTNLGFPTICAGGSAKTFTTNGFLAPLTAATWYVGNNDRGGQSLWRRTAGTTEEIAEGVTDMQVSVLLRNRASQALDSDWVDSSDVADWTATADNEVTAVRITLALESLATVGIDNTPLERELIFVANLRSRSQ